MGRARALVRAAVRLGRDTRGNMALLFAAALPVAIAVAALAVDAAALNYERRALQAGVDLAAIHAAGDPANAAERARLVLADAGLIDPSLALETLLAADTGRLRVETGVYRADPARPAGERFVAGAVGANAVQVALRRPGTLHFARAFFDAPILGASALASATPEAAFSIGSRLLSLDGGPLNQLLGSLLSTTLALNLADYRALADADIAVLDFLDALGGRVGVTAGTYGQLLDSRIRLADIAAALSAAAQDQAAADLLFNLAGVIDDGILVEGARLMALDGLADLGVGTAAAGLDASVSALELLTVAATLADGERQAAVVSGLQLPGLAGVSVEVAVGEPPRGGAWYRVGQPGALVRTAQVRLKFELSVLGHGGLLLGLIGITLPIYAEIAYAEAELAALSCPPGRPDLGVATIAARPGIVRLAIGAAPSSSFTRFSEPLSFERVRIASLAVARIFGHADIRAEEMEPQMLIFTAADVANGTAKTVATTTPVSALTRSLVGGLSIEIEVLGFLPLSLSALREVVRVAVAPIAPVIDNVLVAVLDLLGIGLGEADIRLHGLSCRNAVLVQ